MSSLSYSQSDQALAFGWKSYQLLKKKAMEQELSWSGLVISMSIAFFIVASCALTMRMIVTSMENGKYLQPTTSEERVIDVSNLAVSDNYPFFNS